MTYLHITDRLRPYSKFSWDATLLVVTLHLYSRETIRRVCQIHNLKCANSGDVLHTAVGTLSHHERLKSFAVCLNTWPYVERWQSCTESISITLVCKMFTTFHLTHRKHITPVATISNHFLWTHTQIILVFCVVFWAKGNWNPEQISLRYFARNSNYCFGFCLLYGWLVG